jgi:GNAT superfamily N-acetyltransferase
VPQPIGFTQAKPKGWSIAVHYTIAYLADHPSYVPTLAAWHHVQWSYLDAGVSVEQRISRLEEHGKRKVPTTLLAVSGGMLLGSASLIAHDMDTRMDLSPWLASVYVAQAYRRQGIGSALVRGVIQEAKDLGFAMLYLFTPDKERFYARMGWHVLERTVYRGYPETVMAICLERSRGEDNL